MNLNPEGGARLVRLPQSFRCPVEPSGPIVTAVRTLDGKSFTLLIGGVGPLGGPENRNYPSFGMRHLRLLLRILAVAGNDAREISCSFERLLPYQSGEARRRLRIVLGELLNMWVHRIDDPDRPVVASPLLAAETEISYVSSLDPKDHRFLSQEKSIRSRRLRKLTLNEDFWRACLNWEDCYCVRVDAVERISSDVAAACYLALTPASYHPKISAAAKGRKDAASMLREMGLKVPGKRAELRRMFERQRGSTPTVLQQIAGLPTKDRFFMVDDTLEPNATGEGFNIRYWSISTLEAPGEFARDGALPTLFAKNGLNYEEFLASQNPRLRALESYEIEQLELMGYSVQHNRLYLELVRSIIGPADFHRMLGSIKMAHHSGEIRHGIERYVGGVFKNAVEEYAKNRAERVRGSRHRSPSLAGFRQGGQ